jgi:hypothetical protein
VWLTIGHDRSCLEGDCGRLGSSDTIQTWQFRTYIRANRNRPVRRSAEFARFVRSPLSIDSCSIPRGGSRYPVQKHEHDIE